ncbi:thioredoxin domain-containing protein 2-like, partial [Mercenaria mercenaria]|uniref:thioredoxin domain-containing protein 2-like n=1 Tax=Mercenaria mercenaria TaxID=6596 RepID=UPI00234F7630
KSQCDDVKPTSTDERNPSGESQSSNEEVLKNGESTADTTSTNERENNSGDSEKQTPETVSKGIKKPDDDSSTTLKGDSPKDPSQVPEISPSDVGTSTISKDNLPKASPDAAKENNSGDSEKQTPETVSKGIKKPDDDSSTTLKGDSPKDPSQVPEISPSDVGNSTISKDSLPKASPDAAEEKHSGDSEKQTPETVSKGINQPGDDSSAISTYDIQKDPPEALKNSDRDIPVVSDNQKRLMNDDRKEDKDFCSTNAQTTLSTKRLEEDKRQEETMAVHLRQSLEKNNQLLKRCSDIQKDYENVKKDYEEMERKYESTSKENADLLEKNIKVTKELEAVIQASKDLAEKDIENQRTMFDLKTDLSDIKKRYNDMAQQKSRVENQLKEDQKTWTQEKNKLQKDHEKHKKDMEKANKA